jgi:hypothetical protein
MNAAVHELLTLEPTPPVHDAPSWAAWLATQPSADPLALALRGGFCADRIGWAFASGYQAACQRLLPKVAAGEVVALCASEKGSTHPRAIQTTLGDGCLSGDKSFVTLAPMATLLVVVARAGQDSAGRPRLVGALVRPGGAGVALSEGRALPFIPEVPHGRLVLRAAPCTVLPGDGYTHCLKPFRTIEDIHIQAAMLGLIVQIGRRNRWPDADIEAVLLLIAALSALAEASPMDAAVHRGLGGVLVQLAQLLVALADRPMEPAVRERWQRDQAVFMLAQSARESRLARARG